MIRCPSTGSSIAALLPSSHCRKFLGSSGAPARMNAPPGTRTPGCAAQGGAEQHHYHHLPTTTFPLQPIHSQSPPTPLYYLPSMYSYDTIPVITKVTLQIDISLEKSKSKKKKKNLDPPLYPLYSIPFLLPLPSHLLPTHLLIPTCS